MTSFSQLLFYAHMCIIISHGVYIQSTSFFNQSNNAQVSLFCALKGKLLWIDAYEEPEL